MEGNGRETCINGGGGDKGEGRRGYKDRVRERSKKEWVQRKCIQREGKAYREGLLLNVMERGEECWVTRREREDGREVLGGE